MTIEAGLASVAETKENAATDLAMMRAALALARRGLGSTWPNPSVGCVIVRDRHVIGRGWTGRGGRPHGETEALRRAGAAARGATAYVTLEPCCHWGKTPPCADALIAAGTRRVVVALDDPDPRVAGSGIEALRKAGIAIEVGLCAAEAAELNAGFLQRVRLGRPLVTLKLATSLDGRIATAAGESRWITGPAARERAHLLRARHDAILVGTETALADDPELTCRLPGLADRSPVRVVLDRHLRTAPTARLIVSARQVPTWIVTLVASDPARQEQLRNAGVDIITAEPDAAGMVDLVALLGNLGRRGLTRLLVEGGGRLAAALLRAGLVDRLVWFHAPVLLGGDGVPAVAPLGLDTLDVMPHFERLTAEIVGEDGVTVFRARRPEDSAPEPT
jgi:diaminohydroxyphosphoribosylaminopyrimidine deaminase / 5-amino-6-(5-phosphoribosylamino)uracil reductase